MFGQGTYELNDQFAVTARPALHEGQEGRHRAPAPDHACRRPIGRAAASAFDVSTDIDPTTPGVQNFRALSNSWDAVTGALNLDWTPDADTLGLRQVQPRL